MGCCGVLFTEYCDHRVDEWSVYLVQFKYSSRLGHCHACGETKELCEVLVHEVSLSQGLLREGRLLKEYIRELLYSSLVISLLVRPTHFVHSCLKACRVGTSLYLSTLDLSTLAPIVKLNNLHFYIFSEYDIKRQNRNVTPHSYSFLC